MFMKYAKAGKSGCEIMQFICNANTVQPNIPWIERSGLHLDTFQHCGRSGAGTGDIGAARCHSYG